MESTTIYASDTNHAKVIQGQMNQISWIDGEAEESIKTSALNNELGDTSGNGSHDAHVPDPRAQYMVSKLDANGNRVENPGGRLTTQDTQDIKERTNGSFTVEPCHNGYLDNNEPISNGLDENGKYHSVKNKKVKIILKGQELRNIMQDVLGKYLEHDQRTDWAAKDQTLENPFSSEIRYFNELSKASRSSQGSEQGRKALRDLLEEFQRLEPDIVALVSTIQEATKIHPDDLYYLFRPGDLVISKSYLGEPQLFRVSDCNWTNIDKIDVFKIVVWAFDWTGIELTQNYYSFQYIPNKKSGEKAKKLDIIDLPCYPVRYYKNNEGASGDEVLKALSDDLIARGQTFRNLCRESKNGKQYTYDGEILCSPRHGPRAQDFVDLVMIKDNIMVDFEGYKRWGPNLSIIGNLGDLTPHFAEPCTCKLCLDESSNCHQWMRDFADKNGENDRANEKCNNLLLPPRVLGYSLQKKIWAQFHVRTVQDIPKPTSDEWSERVVFPEESENVKQDLRILIEQHGKPISHMIGDPVAGKGRGLVVLLHGPPGVGKTLTVETLAKSSGKPLYVTGASDIGVEPEITERRLAYILELVERWGAVLLIDEADVFLDSRGSKGEADVQKNALVSVMLRVLEYFKGIMIMTTNRIMTFDVAMLSRCHYAVEFKSLTREQERRIWQGYVDQLNEHNSERKSDIEAWVAQITKKRTKLSGRDIRNVFTTAQTLAQAEHNKKIKRKHLERVYERLYEFLEAMEKTMTTAQARLSASGISS